MLYLIRWEEREVIWRIRDDVSFGRGVGRRGRVSEPKHNHKSNRIFPQEKEKGGQEPFPTNTHALVYVYVHLYILWEELNYVNIRKMH